MKRKKLIIFVDSLAHYYLEDYRDALPFLSSAPATSAVRPGLGYSINAKAELFGGHKPDDLGYFCYWTHEEGSRFKRWSKHLGHLAPLRHINIIDRIAHRLLSKAFGIDLFTIPFDQYQYFDIGKYFEVYDERFPFSSIFKEFSMTCITNESPGIGRDSDNAVVAAGEKAIASNEADCLFLTLVELDAVTHRNSVGSDQHLDKLSWLDKTIRRLSESFMDKCDGDVYVLGDHGMANIKGIAPFDPEREFGRMREDRYIYFTDATMVRMWVKDKAMAPELTSYTDGLNAFQLLDSEARAEMGVSNPKFGDLIFIVNEGLAPSPTHVSGTRMRAKALHGYHPHLRRQKAAFVSLNPLHKPLGSDVSATELHDALRRELRNAE